MHVIICWVSCECAVWSMKYANSFVLLLVCDLNRTPIVMAKHGRLFHAGANMGVPVSIFQESPLAGEPRERLFHIHSVRYQLCAKYLYPSTLL